MSSNETLKEQLKRVYTLNRWLKAHTTHYCPIVSSKEIKQAIVTRMNDLGVSPYEICIRADVSYNTFKKYYLDREESESRPSLRPEDLNRIGKLIGFEIRTRLVMCDIDLIDRSKLLNDKYIPHARRKKNKKLS